MYTNILTNLGLDTWLFLALIVPIALINQLTRLQRSEDGSFVKGPNQHYLFAYILGSILSFAMLAFGDALKGDGFAENPFLLAVGVVTIVILWKLLFGPWGAHIKAAVLGTFIGWIGLSMVRDASVTEQVAFALATIVALIPAFIWCLLFLRYHTRQFSTILLTFFAGCLSTVPILFYDKLVRGGTELHFFLFSVTPINFARSSKEFVSQSLAPDTGLVTTSVATLLVSSILVGLIEEISKNWVVRKSDRAQFQSIDDVLQLCIIAAIGFAFAENIINPNYFIGFVRQYLLAESGPYWGMFTASVFGRSLITSMVHITCSGILGYFYALSFFAKPVLEEDRALGKPHLLLGTLRRLFHLPRIQLYRSQMMAVGLFFSIGIHSVFNFTMSVSDALPGNPQTLGEVFGYTGFLSSLNFAMIPAALIVFGGWFLLQFLFTRSRNMKAIGYRLEQEVFVTEEAART